MARLCRFRTFNIDNERGFVKRITYSFSLTGFQRICSCSCFCMLRQDWSWKDQAGVCCCWKVLGHLNIRISNGICISKGTGCTMVIVSIVEFGTEAVIVVAWRPLLLGHCRVHGTHHNQTHGTYSSLKSIQWQDSNQTT